MNKAELVQQIFSEFNNENLIRAINLTNFPSEHFNHFRNIRNWIVDNPGLLSSKEKFPFLENDAWERSNKAMSNFVFA